jgi:hypothetical protein
VRRGKGAKDWLIHLSHSAAPALDDWLAAYGRWPGLLFCRIRAGDRLTPARPSATTGGARPPTNARLISVRRPMSPTSSGNDQDVERAKERYALCERVSAGVILYGLGLVRRSWGVLGGRCFDVSLISASTSRVGGDQKIVCGWRKS